MGIGGISIWQLLIILVIVLLLFGTKRLKGFGGDLGSAIKGFKKAMSEEEKNEDPKKVEEEKHENNNESPSSETEKDSVKTESK